MGLTLTIAALLALSVVNVDAEPVLRSLKKKCKAKSGKAKSGKSKAGKSKKGKKGKKGGSISILHMNDHHSHLDADNFDFDCALIPELSCEDGKFSITYGGFPLIVGLMKSMTTADTIKLHAGDAITGTSFFSLFDGEADAEMMQAACFDAFVLGNHEFDKGDDGLAEFLRYLNEKEKKKKKHKKHKKHCTTPVLGANVVPGLGSPLIGMIDPYTILETESGDVVGVIGIDIRFKTLFSSQPSEGTTLLDEAETAQAMINELTSCGIDKIILLTHIGLDYDMAWLAELDGVDVIVGGDSHSLLAETDGPASFVGNAIGPYPTMVGHVCIVQAWEYAHGFGMLDVTFDKDGVVISCEGSIKFPYDPTGVPAEINSYLSATNIFYSVKADADATASLVGFKDQVDVQKKTVIASVPETICYDRFPGQGLSKLCNPTDTALQGGGVGNVVAKSFMTVTPTADFAIENAGGSRTDIGKGDFSIEDAYTLLPFANTLVTFEMTGAQIVAVLNEALNYALAGNSGGAYPYASGLRYDVDASTRQLSNVEGNSRVSEQWKPIDLDKVFTVVTNSYLAGGGSGYVTFTKIETAVNTYTEYAQAFIDYAILVETLEDLPLLEYSTKSFDLGSIRLRK